MNSNKKQTYFVGGHPMGNTIHITECERINPNTQKLLKFKKGTCDICNRSKSQTFTKEMTRGEDFMIKKMRKLQYSTMSNSAWCDLNNKGDILKFHDMCLNLNCKCQKQITFTPNQLQLEGAGFINNIEKTIKGSQKSMGFFS